VVWRLDRLSRSLRDVLTIMERIREAEAGFRSLTEAIDTIEKANAQIKRAAKRCYGLVYLEVSQRNVSFRGSQSGRL
jgi:hypothetical protein